MNGFTREEIIKIQEVLDSFKYEINDDITRANLTYSLNEKIPGHDFYALYCSDDPEDILIQYKNSFKYSEFNLEEKVDSFMDRFFGCGSIPVENI